MRKHLLITHSAAYLAVLVCATLFVVTPLCGQQTYVTRYDLFTGYTFLDSPKVSLFENGFHFQIGVRPKTWYSLGFDYSIAKGDLSLTPDLLTQEIQQRLGASLGALAAAGRLPSGYALKVNVSSRTQTFAAGPQLAYRRLKQATFFLRPSIGYIREVATPKPADAIATGIVAQLAPTGKKDDWTKFYGVGFGVDLNFSHHFAWRVQADIVRDHLFPDMLRDSRNTVRFSVGPAFNFGPNIVEQ